MKQHVSGWALFNGDLNMEPATVTIVSIGIELLAPTEPAPYLAPPASLITLGAKHCEAAMNLNAQGNEYSSQRRLKMSSRNMTPRFTTSDHGWSI